MARSSKAAGKKVKGGKPGARVAGGKESRKVKGWSARACAAVARRIRILLRAAARVGLAFGWRAGIVGVLLFSLTVFYFYSRLPELSELLDTRTRGTIALLDRNGDVFSWRGSQLSAVTAEEASPNLVNAVVAAEDRSFYDHSGLSLRGIAGAIFINLREGRGPLSGHGGSTITQQVSKLLCLGIKYDPASGKSEREFERDCRRSTIWRKIKEVPYAVALRAQNTRRTKS